MGPAQIALAFSAGHAEATVRRRPRMVAIDTGDELSSDPEHCPEHQIPMSNGAMIATLAKPWVEGVKLVGPVPDHLDEQCGHRTHYDGLSVGIRGRLVNESVRSSVPPR